MHKFNYDFLTPGIVAGIIGAMISGVYEIIIKGLRIASNLFLEFSQVIILFHTKNSIPHSIIGWGIHLIIGSICGVIISYIIKFTSNKYYLFKGTWIGLCAWGFLLSVGTLYKMPNFTKIQPIPALAMVIGSAFWGLSTAYALKIITKNFKYYFD